ncbi:MAG: hypothetical protein AB1563_12265, partial [Bacillota bacterium]
RLQDDHHGPSFEHSLGLWIPPSAADAARWSREDQDTCIGGILGTSFVRDLVPGDPPCVVFESEAKRGGPHGIRINAKLVPQG